MEMIGIFDHFRFHFQVEMEMVLEMEMEISMCSFGAPMGLKLGQKCAKTTQLAEPVRSALLFLSEDQ